ncbi:MAG: EF2563 family selenium-dependent molybdenum hydroxylase system protein [Firmicutes bacterium]|nr:EF2563 family selenium-dependent molybdenum hydroxylase system protein [Bacillota bacterium]
MVIIKGAGDIASGIALRLFHCGYKIIMTDLPKPTSIRRTVCFSQSVIDKKITVEDVTAEYAENPEKALDIVEKGNIAVVADEKCEILKSIKPDVLVDAVLAKKNTGTNITDAPAVIGVGPGFTAGKDCHFVVETKRGHTLGRVIDKGSAIPNTGIPGNIEGFTWERLIQAPKDGIFVQKAEIGDIVKKGDIVGYVDDEPVFALIDGVLRGILPTGTRVYKGMKSGDVDPRGNIENCYTVSDKALSVAGGVLEAILRKK